MASNPRGYYNPDDDDGEDLYAPPPPPRAPVFNPQPQDAYDFHQMPSQSQTASSAGSPSVRPQYTSLYQDHGNSGYHAPIDPGYPPRPMSPRSVASMSFGSQHVYPGYGGGNMYSEDWNQQNTTRERMSQSPVYQSPSLQTHGQSYQGPQFQNIGYSEHYSSAPGGFHQQGGPNHRQPSFSPSTSFSPPPPYQSPQPYSHHSSPYLAPSGDNYPSPTFQPAYPSQFFQEGNGRASISTYPQEPGFASRSQTPVASIPPSSPSSVQPNSYSQQPESYYPSLDRGFGISPSVSQQHSSRSVSVPPPHQENHRSQTPFNGVPHSQTPIPSFTFNPISQPRIPSVHSKPPRPGNPSSGTSVTKLTASKGKRALLPEEKGSASLPSIPAAKPPKQQAGPVKSGENPFSKGKASVPLLKMSSQPQKPAEGSGPKPSQVKQPTSQVEQSTSPTDQLQTSTSVMQSTDKSEGNPPQVPSAPQAPNRLGNPTPKSPQLPSKLVDPAPITFVHNGKTLVRWADPYRTALDGYNATDSMLTNPALRETPFSRTPLVPEVYAEAHNLCTDHMYKAPGVYYNCLWDLLKRRPPPNAEEWEVNKEGTHFVNRFDHSTLMLMVFAVTVQVRSCTRINPNGKTAPSSSYSSGSTVWGPCDDEDSTQNNAHFPLLLQDNSSTAMLRAVAKALKLKDWKSMGYKGIVVVHHSDRLSNSMADKNLMNEIGGEEGRRICDLWEMVNSMKEIHGIKVEFCQANWEAELQPMQLLEMASAGALPLRVNKGVVKVKNDEEFEWEGKKWEWEGEKMKWLVNGKVEEKEARGGLL
ncbi:hypothetical protein TWF281_006310 [Arthrobotrys megalospora]